MPWKVGEAVRAAGGRAPKIFYETGAVGKEPVSVLVGRDPLEVAGQICTLARDYHEYPANPGSVRSTPGSSRSSCCRG